ncbi:MAG: cyclic nucleotide-binding domain-containing protein [Dehalococcoidia bacterium]|jgi:CRP-like cAMP-binding protein|nr:MAG: cyclic nucleotide-binding domain-containing protein [Dehalococcoidia bacterium]
METAQRIPIEALQVADIFAGIPDSYLEQIAKCCAKRTYRAGDYCAMQGKTPDYVVIVNDGKLGIEMRVDTPRYSHNVITGTLTKGRVGAWSALVPPFVLPASLKCLEDSDIISIKTSDLQRIFKENPAVEAMVMRNLAVVIGSRLKDCHAKLGNLIAELIKLAS